MSSAATTYLNQALDLMQRYGLQRKELDWPGFRREIFAYIKGAQTAQETYPAIVYACTQSKNRCSLELPAETAPEIQTRGEKIKAEAWAASHGRPLTPTEPSPFLDRYKFSLAMLRHGDERFAYMVIPAAETFHSDYGDPRLRHQWAEGMFGLVTKATQLGAQGWVLDLRGNRRGYMASMFAGLQSLLGNERS